VVKQDLDAAPRERSSSVNFWPSKRRLSSPQPPYSPDLAPEDFLLFLKLKPTPKGLRFQTIEETEENSLRDLCAVPQNAFQNWNKKKLEAAYGQWRGVLCRRQVLLSCRFINISFKKNVRLLLDRPHTYYKT
jgi:hypothetical protein